MEDGVTNYQNGFREMINVGPLDEPKYTNLINQYERTEVLELNAIDRPSCDKE